MYKKLYDALSFKMTAQKDKQPPTPTKPRYLVWFFALNLTIKPQNHTKKYLKYPFESRLRCKIKLGPDESKTANECQPSHLSQGKA